MSDIKPPKGLDESSASNEKKEQSHSDPRKDAVDQLLKNAGVSAAKAPVLDRQDHTEAAASNDHLTLPPFGFAEDILRKISGGQAVDNRAGIDDVSHYESQLSDRQSGQSMKYVTFFCDDEEYGIPILHVREINRLVDITRVPNTSTFIRGVINLRGRIVPVIDLKEKLNLGTTVPSRLSRIMIVELGQLILGLIVDRVSTVLTLNSDQIELPAEELFHQQQNYIRGVGKIEERMILILALDRILEWQA